MDNLVPRFSGDFAGVKSEAPVYSDLKKNDLAPPSFEDGDFSDATLEFISQMLMEEDLENLPCMYQHSLALQATEKSFCDVLDSNRDEKKVRKNQRSENTSFVEEERCKKCCSANSEEQFDPLKLFDKILLRDGRREFSFSQGFKEKNKNQVVDLSTMLTHCAQAVANSDFKTACEEINKIRHFSSPFGDASQRLAHYFANALEARMAGNGTRLFTTFDTKKASAADHLLAYRVSMSVCPFNELTNLAATLMIAEVAKKATTLHIIDFGVFYGYQWPSLIERLSNIPGGGPKLRITGIDLPQPGIQPAERVERTGHRLRKYCERFKVPFEYTAIAKKWQCVRVEDVKINRDEVTIVNCFHRLRNVPDETTWEASEKSARDRVLKLIRVIDPDMFIHSVVNGSYNAPFFDTRFREALFHFSAFFDMIEANVPRESRERMLIEKEILGRDVMNVIACEGWERVERPEKYKQWETRSVRSGLRLMPLKKGIVERMRAKVKLQYHKDFLVDDDGGWMLQGWKGRVLLALSCWKRA